MAKKADIVLVIDDTAVGRALRFLLEVEGYCVRLYGSSAAVLAETDLARSHCVVVDSRMPALGSIELVETLRAHGIAVPVILLADRLDGASLDRCARAGVHRILQMPVMDSSLLEAVASALGR